MAKIASSARVVCWQNREEWLYVYKALYSFDDPEIQRKGVDRVAAWRSRSAGKLPLAIECTANLISAQLALHSDIDGYEVQGRLTLSMAIVRFVNGMADQVQKGKFARSVQSIADEIGLPDWLVDLRHEATHASLPSMETLQSGLHTSLSWLQGQYWEAQINMHEEYEEKLLQLLNEYKDVALSHATNRKKTAKLKSSSKMKELSDEIANVASMSNLWSILPNILSQEDMLVPSRALLNTLGVIWPLEDSSSDSSIPAVPKEMIKMWKTLLETLDISSSEFMTSLVIHFLEKLSDVKDNQTKVLSCGFAAWIKHLLQEQSTKKPSLLLRSDFPWVHVLRVTLENPTVYSLEIIPLILDNLPLVFMKERIQHLVSVMVNLEGGQLGNMEESEPSDLEQWMMNRRKTSTELQLSESREDSAPASLGWQVSQGSSQWHLIPFGEVIGTSDTSPINLEMSQPSGDPICIESGTECLSGTEHDEIITGYNDEAVHVDCDSDNSEDMSIDQNSEQPCHTTQGGQPVEMIVEADHELTELSHTEAVEGENDVSLIPNQIFLF